MSTHIIHGNSEKPISFDVDLPANPGKYPVILFLHGFKGFKDWGHWPLMASELTRHGFAVVRMNFSHNGTTPEHPMDFADLEAFGDSTFSKEAQDVQDVINWLFENAKTNPSLDLGRLYLLAHSRGGAIAMVTAAEDERVKKLATLSSVSYLDRYTPAELEQWRKHGVVYMLNGRTNQQMPLKISLADDYLKNIDRFELKRVVPRIRQPYLVVHAEKDETVPLSEGENIASWGNDTQLKVIAHADHSFGGKHPFDQNELPFFTQQVVDAVADFFSK